MNNYDPKKRLKETFSKNLNYYMDKHGINRKSLSRKLDIPYTTVSAWATGERYPHPGKIEELANLFGINKIDLIEDDPSPITTSCDEAWEIRKALQAKPHLKILFTMTVNASKEDVEKITKMLELFSEQC